MTANMKKRSTRILLAALIVAVGAANCPGQTEPFSSSADSTAAFGATGSTMPSIGDIVNVIDKASSPTGPDGKSPEWSGPVKLVVIFTMLAIIPSLLAMTTSFTRIVIVLSFIRQALGTQSIPPNTAVMGLALFLTLFTMAPTFSKINNDAIEPYLAEEIDFGQMGVLASNHMKDFMIRQTRQDDWRVFIKMSNTRTPETFQEMPLYVVVPAFVVSEFRTAFEIGCLLFIPFLLLDLVIASILLSAGMMMLPPVMISMPFKLILFILVDGWSILANSLSLSFR